MRLQCKIMKDSQFGFIMAWLMLIAAGLEDNEILEIFMLLGSLFFIVTAVLFACKGK